MNKKTIITCEHGGNDVPPEYSSIFKDATDVLNSHKGVDFGALVAARSIAEGLDAPLFYTTITRLLVEANRTEGKEGHFSDLTDGLPATEKLKIIQKYYYPYRVQVEEEVKQAVDQGKSVVHLSIHSFTPQLNGQTRETDLGILYDERVREERDFAVALEKEFLALAPEMRVKHNYPYSGRADGFTTYLRKKYPGDEYIGIEIEMNQKLFFNGEEPFFKFIHLLTQSLRKTLHHK